MVKDKCEDCPVEAFKVIKRIIWTIASILGTVILVGGTAIVHVDEKIDDGKLHDSKIHTRNTIKVDTNEENISKITEALKEQTRAFNAMSLKLESIRR